jgi:hypothetical protein
MFYNITIVIPRHCVPVLNIILVPVKEHLHGRTYGMNDCLKGGSLLFENEIRNAYLMANADRKAEPI